jgi:hypothetical protein
MEGIFIINEPGIAQVVTSKYGCSFSANVMNNEDNSYIYENISASELSEPILSFSANLVNNQSIGDTDIELDDVTDLNVSDRLRIGSYIYAVKNIINTTITIDPLMENLSNESVIRVGNLGIYSFTFEFDVLGIFTLIAKDSVFGLNTSRIIKVKQKSIETMVNDIKNLEYAILGGQ